MVRVGLELLCNALVELAEIIFDDLEPLQLRAHDKSMGHLHARNAE